MKVNGILLVSSFCGVCSAVSRSISWASLLLIWYISDRNIQTFKQFFEANLVHILSTRKVTFSQTLAV